MDNVYIPELVIQMLERDINDAIYELRNDNKKLINSIDSLIVTTDLLKAGWNTESGEVSMDKINELTSDIEKIAKGIMLESNNIPVDIKHEII